MPDAVAQRARFSYWLSKLAMKMKTNENKYIGREYRNMRDL